MVQTLTKPETETVLLELPKTLKLYVTQEQFAALAASNRELRLERTAGGELVESYISGGAMQAKEGKHLTHRLDLFYPMVQLVLSCPETPTLGGRSRTRPDASWVSQERWDALTPEQKEGFANICPDFVVELRSVSDTMKSLEEKMQEYMDNGAVKGWLIDPQNRKVEVYRLGSEVEVLSNPAELSGEAV
ncbi:MAG: Uma2 family endonuclease [Hormoscilla sp. GUM202]|nr:Uma2 family endonuclease [Hormoscilla sp. GUM202]